MSHSAEVTPQSAASPGAKGLSESSVPTERSSAARSAAEETASWLGTEACIFDRGDGSLLHAPAAQPETDWDRYADLAREAARSGAAEIIALELPLAAIAFPLTCAGFEFAGVSWFAAKEWDTDLAAKAAKQLGLDEPSVQAWLQTAEIVPSEFMLRLAATATERNQAQLRITQVEREVEKLSNHLCQTYEEISLIYRLTHNLTLSRSEEELGELALRWLAEIMPSEGLALQFNEGQAIEGAARPQTRLACYGPCPVNNQQFDEMVSMLDLDKQRRPVVINKAPPGKDAWPWPELRDVVLVPMSEGNEHFGWLAAFNHAGGGEFGTVEADLMNSVNAILGIHRGNTLLYRKQIDLLANMVRALTSSIDAKDPYTRGHSDRVARGAVVLAEQLGCDEETLDTIYLSGLLHDIGKIGIDDTVLRKPDKLTAEEFEHIKTHVTIGYNILRDIKQLKGVLPVVLHHHEAWDGSGYPHGLTATDIPWMARITAVADAFDAMGSDRPYRSGMKDDRLDAVLREGAGKQWDADVVNAFFQQREQMRQIARGEHKGIPRDLTACWRI